MADPLTKQQQREARKAVTAGNQLAGLELREQQVAEQAQQNDMRNMQSGADYELRKADFLRKQALSQYELAEQIKARNESIGFLNALSTLSEKDPDFELKAAVARSNFPYANGDETAQKFYQIKLDAHQKVKADNLTVIRETGLDPWGPDFTTRDSATGRYLYTDWAKHGSAVNAARTARTKAILAGAPLGGKVETKVGDSTVTVDQPTAVGIVAKADVPVADPAKVAAGDVTGAVVAVNEGVGQVQADKVAAANAKTTAAAMGVQLRALAASNDIIGPAKQALLDLAAKAEKEATPAAAPAKAKTKEELLNILKSK